jgi:putative ABC transport system ATP-binding protein
MDTVIETRGLHKTYRNNGVAVEALRGVDLEVTRREFVAVMGPSGCGKSTLLHMLGGLDRPTAGEVTVMGRRMDALDESARAVLRRAAVGFVFQTYNLIPNLSVADNVDLPGLLIGQPPTRPVPYPVSSLWGSGSG